MSRLQPAFRFQRSPGIDARAAPPIIPPVPYIYILRCGDGSLYTGIAKDVEARLAKHAAGRGARYTRGRGPLALVHVEPARSHGAALRREAAIRRLRRSAKEGLGINA